MYVLCLYTQMMKDCYLTSIGIGTHTRTHTRMECVLPIAGMDHSRSGHARAPSPPAVVVGDEEDDGEEADDEDDKQIKGKEGRRGKRRGD